MSSETVSAVEVTQNNELLLVLESQGKPEDAHIYRAAAGVYWENEKHGFRSTLMREWSHSKWYAQIISVVKSELGVGLALSANVRWAGVPLGEQQEIFNADAV